MGFKFFCLMLVVFVGLRHQVGGDWFNYQDMYDQISNLSLFQSLIYTEPAYGLINWLMYQVGLSVHFVNLICAVVFISGLGYFCLKLPQPWFALLISTPYLITAVGMGYTRQSAAIGFGLISLVMLFEKNTWRFLFFIFLGALFHKSVLVMLMLLPLTLPKFKLGRLVFIGLLSLLLGVFFVLDRLAGMWNLYVTQGMESDGGLVRILLNLIPALCFLSTISKWRNRWPKYYKLLLWFSIGALILFPLQFLVSTVADRVSLYIIPLQIMVFSCLPLLFEGRQQYLCLSFIFVLYSCVYLVWLNFSNWAQCCWIPYNNFLFTN